MSPLRRPTASGRGGLDPIALAYVVPFALAKAAVDRSRRGAFDEPDPEGFGG
ncbi:hypothetical protein [Halorubrum sp. Boch-26]|uniref:hypothetical protein n=1 Tax=Halorubrum sp. Boch-26 TaxID=2994426 RepID=UPI0024695A1E|nr:hypothetical protein [Halorubrum sp. Boch-26]